MRRQSPAIIISLVALFVALSSTAYAATGGTFILGKSNTASSLSSLTNRNGTALRLSSSAGKPPLNVGNSVQVPKLNASLLDGLASTRFQLKSDTVPMAAGSIDFGTDQRWDIGPDIILRADCYADSDGSHHLDELILNNAPGTGSWDDSEMVETTTSTESPFGHAGVIESGLEKVVTQQADPSPSKYVGPYEFVNLIWSDSSGEVITATYVGIVYANYCALYGTLTRSG